MTLKSQSHSRKHRPVTAAKAEKKPVCDGWSQLMEFVSCSMCVYTCLIFLPCAEAFKAVSRPWIQSHDALWFFYLPLSFHQRSWFLQRKWLRRFSVCVLLWSERQQQRPVEGKDRILLEYFSFEYFWSQRPCQTPFAESPITHTLYSTSPMPPTW